MGNGPLRIGNFLTQSNTMEIMPFSYTVAYVPHGSKTKARLVFTNLKKGEDGIHSENQLQINLGIG